MQSKISLVYRPERWSLYLDYYIIVVTRHLCLKNCSQSYINTLL